MFSKIIQEEKDLFSKVQIKSKTDQNCQAIFIEFIELFMLFDFQIGCTRLMCSYISRILSKGKDWLQMKIGKLLVNKNNPKKER